MKVPQIKRKAPLADAPLPAASDKGMSVIKTHAAYMRGNVGPTMSGWNPALRDTQTDVQVAWQSAVARTTEMVQNSGWIAGGINAAIGAIIGAGLRLVATPDTTLVKFDGLTDDSGQPIDADGWARFVERRWEAWANNPLECDALARNTVAQNAVAQMKMWFATGEIVTLLPYHKDELAMTGTKILVLPSWKLSQKNDSGNRIVQGVQMDSRGRPYAYFFRQKDAAGLERDVSILARDGANRPQVIHIYDGLPGQVRGMTVMAPVLQVVRQYDQLTNATLTAAIIQSIVAATIESDLPTAEVMQALQTDEEQQGIGGGSLEDFLAARLGWAQTTTIDLNNQSKIAHLFPGETLKFNRSEHTNGNLEAFVKILLREIAKALNVTESQLTGDYSGVTYTGVRMSTTDNWPTTLHRRQNIMGRWYQMIYEAWLEEEIESGRIKFPGGIDGFLKLRPSAVRAKWRGPAKPQADELKTAKMHQVYREMGVMSDTQIADDLGERIEDVYESRRREKDIRTKFDLDDVGPSIQTKVAEITAEGNEDDEPAENAA